MYKKVTKYDFRPRPSWALRLQEAMFQRCKELNKTRDVGEEETEIEEPEDSQKGLAEWI